MRKPNPSPPASGSDEPWKLETFEFWFPGDPPRKERPRVCQKGDRAWAYTPQRTREAEHRLKIEANVKMGPYWRPDKEYLWGVSVELYFSSQKHGDADNALKALLDALQGVLFANDKQVHYVEARIASEDSVEPGMSVTAWRMKRKGA